MTGLQRPSEYERTCIVPTLKFHVTRVALQTAYTAQLPPIPHLYLTWPQNYNGYQAWQRLTSERLLNWLSAFGDEVDDVRAMVRLGGETCFPESHWPALAALVADVRWDQLSEHPNEQTYWSHTTAYYNGYGKRDFKRLGVEPLPLSRSALICTQMDLQCLYPAAPLIAGHTERLAAIGLKRRKRDGAKRSDGVEE